MNLHNLRRIKLRYWVVVGIIMGALCAGYNWLGLGLALGLTVGQKFERREWEEAAARKELNKHQGVDHD